MKVLPLEAIDPEASRDRPVNFITDCTKFTRETGFIEPIPLKEQIAKTLAWALENPEALGEKPDYKKEEELIKRYEQAIETF